MKNLGKIAILWLLEYMCLEEGSGFQRVVDTAHLLVAMERMWEECNAKFLLFVVAFLIGASETGSSMALQVDNINAYSYSYPLRPGKKSRNLSWVESRKPERYSSAAPLSPDARQRIVSERLDLKNNIVMSVSVGPINSTFLKTNDSSTWDAKDVARSVLSDKSTAVSM
jgi:hypothetical protein